MRRATVRLGAQAGAGALLVTVLLAAVTVVVLLRDQDAAAATSLADAVSRADDVGDPPSRIWLIIRDRDGTQHTPGLPPGVSLDAELDRVDAGGAPEIVDLTVDHTPLRARVEEREIPGRGRIAVAAVLDLRPGQAQLTSVLRALLAGGLVALALASLFSVWFAHRAVRPLAGALSTQRRFVADASHELRTPLTLLSTRVQLLRRRLLVAVRPADLRDDVDGVVADAQRLTAILDDLLLAADPRQTVPDRQVDLVALARDVAAAAAPAAAAAHVTVTTAVPPDAGHGAARVTGSAAGLRRALTALTDNAVRHARHRVTITVSRARRAVIVEVADDGAGIGEDVLPRMFDRFASSRAEDGCGVRRYGLGLALVAEVVDRHGGSVSAATGPDGAVLRVLLPPAERDDGAVAAG